MLIKSKDTVNLLREMCLGDVIKVVQIIHAHDEEDAEAAEADYEELGYDEQFVLEENDEVIGVTGYREVPGADGSYWLSWTYLAAPFRGKGVGHSMITQLIEKLKEKKGRKLFVKLSDYQVAGEEKLYGQAFKTYDNLGFKEAVLNLDFYDKGENQHILALDLQPMSGVLEDATASVAEEKPIMRFDGLYEIAETEAAYSFSWTVKDKKGFFEKRGFSVYDLKVGLESVIKHEGRKVFLTFPSNLPLINMPLKAAGFQYIGKIKDYYEVGVDELHFSHDLTGVDKILENQG